SESKSVWSILTNKSLLYPLQVDDEGTSQFYYRKKYQREHHFSLRGNSYYAMLEKEEMDGD
ncbi:hypothetical protein J1N35_018120, partial [Gossypium stocksii]